MFCIHTHIYIYIYIYIYKRMLDDWWQANVLGVVSREN